MRYLSLAIVFMLISVLVSCDNNNNSLDKYSIGSSSSALSSITGENGINTTISSDNSISTSYSNGNFVSSTADSTAITSAKTANTTPISTTTNTPVSSTVMVTIPEGYSLAQIAELMEKNGVCKSSELIKTVNSYDFSYYSLVSKIPNNANRCFKLEGYLFADTYEFYLNEKPENVIGKLLRNNEAVINEKIRNSAKSMGLSIDEVLTIASIIEKESGKTSEMKKISSVIHNRLKIQRKLECDVTINYVERYIKPYITGDKNRYNADYNTYKCSALPAGPICNPSLNAINAAVSPENNDYLFFVSDKQGNYYYASTGIEHKENVIKAGLEWVD